VSNPRSTNRSMFWRIVRRLLTANRGRLFVILLALGAGAAVTAALLNLQVDAKHRLTTEFRALGANVIVAPKGGQSDASNGGTLSEDAWRQIPKRVEGVPVAAAPFLYVVADVSTPDAPPVKAVVVGTYLHSLYSIAPSWQIYPHLGSWNASSCIVGSRLSSRLKPSRTAEFRLSVGEKNFSCYANQTLSSGGAEDNQIFVYLPAAQSLASLPERVSLIQVGVPGTPQSLERYIADLQKQLPDADVHGIRQFVEAEAKIYNRISGLLNATVAVVLVLTALCVMAAMTNVAMERKNDVGLMKAIGGATRRVLRLFLAEAALLGLVGGILGATTGILLSIWLGKAVFGVAARPRLIVYPVAVALTIIVAIAGAYPLRRLASIRPASVFRGEA
jgi:putative ABC transport system permease protein